MKKNKKEKEPSLFRKLVDIHYEQAKRRKALRILSKQAWSVEFMEYLVKHAAQDLHQDIVISVVTPSGHKLEIKSVKSSMSSYAVDNDIFDHLDDQAAVDAFIRDHSRR